MARRIVSLSSYAAGIIAITLVGLGAIGRAADRPRLHWNIKEGAVVERTRGERLYLEACRVIENRFAAAKVVRPEMTVHVGTSCPDAAVTGACLSPATAELFLPQWDEEAPGAITQATLMVGMMQLMTPDELLRITQRLLTEDGRDFVDARSAAKD